MQVASSAVAPSPTTPQNPTAGETSSPLAVNTDPRLAQYKVIRRNGAVVGFEPSKIAIAVTKAFLAVNGGQSAASSRVRELTAQLTDHVVTALMRRKPEGGAIHIEEIQDQVELALMRGGEHEVARAYVLYREKRAQERAHEKQKGAKGDAATTAINVVEQGVSRPLDLARLKELVQSSCAGLAEVEPERILKATLKDLYEGVPMDEVRKCVVLAARTLIEKDPAYSFVTARLLLDSIRYEAMGEECTQADMATKYAEYFPRFVKHGIKIGLLNEALAQYDLKTLGKALAPQRDLQFGYLGLQTLYDRYFLVDQYVGGRRFELPQCFFMRVAMGLALNEVDREARAIEFYNVLSTFDFMSSTPTLFNSGTHRSQLSSCYLTTVADDLDGIYEAIKENALLSKFAGGLGNDWTNVRAMGSHIKGTNGKSQGVVPFLKVVNDTAVAVNQCFAPDTPVYTARGVQPIREVRVGDLVLGKSGVYREVLEKLVYNQHEPMLAINVKHSLAPIEVTDRHPFWVIRGVSMEQSIEATTEALTTGTIRGEWIDACKLQCGDFIGLAIPSEVLSVDGIDVDDTYFYGLMLGAGNISKDSAHWTISKDLLSTYAQQFIRRYLLAYKIVLDETSSDQVGEQLSWNISNVLTRDATTNLPVHSEYRFPFDYSDFCDDQSRKRISHRLAHLPRPLTKALLRGVLVTTGGILNHGKEIYFQTKSQPLAEGIRYQMLRLRVPVSGEFGECDYKFDRKRDPYAPKSFSGTTRSYLIRTPIVPEVGAIFYREASGERDWISHGNFIYSPIKSVGPIPVKPLVVDLKVDVDESYMTASGLAHNGGKRKGAVCSYLETWHLDIEEFLELRKNTGDDRRRTHDMNTANWIPDLFMKRVMEGGEWTLFSPSDVPDLHDKWGRKFEEAYTRYEEKAAKGELKVYKRIPATQR